MADFYDQEADLEQTRRRWQTLNAFMVYGGIGSAVSAIVALSGIIYADINGINEYNLAAATVGSLACIGTGLMSVNAHSLASSLERLHPELRQAELSADVPLEVIERQQQLGAVDFGDMGDTLDMP